MAIRCLNTICSSARSLWNLNAIAVAHRLGPVSVGETISKVNDAREMMCVIGEVSQQMVKHRHYGLNIEKLDENIVQKHGGSKQVGFKQLGPGVEAGVPMEYMLKNVEDKHGLLGKGAGKGISDWVEDQDGIQQQNGLVNKTNVTLFAKNGFNQCMARDEFEMNHRDGHTFEVEPHGNVDHVVGSQEYREDSNEAAFAVAAVEKIYAHESLTFNNTVACEVISKWKAGLKDDMDARSDVYVLSNGCKKCSDDSDGYYWESTPVGSQEYQMVCTRLDIASADVGMLDKFDRGLQTDVQVFVDFDYAMAAYMTLTGAWKKEIWLKGLLAESGYELSLVAGIATGALVKGGSRSEVPAQVEGAAYRSDLRIRVDHGCVFVKGEANTLHGKKVINEPVPIPHDYSYDSHSVIAQLIGGEVLVFVSRSTKRENKECVHLGWGDVMGYLNE
ncbi:zinc finger, CCHC-type containing protein [Tanacetum coccineum]|uniref:Zinc finger, CCHC-type containing protein n=1 Tax=Tanacetum coccineum TaxID=301880 RepID=A0ABQ5IPY4_9ASTR